MKAEEQAGSGKADEEKASHEPSSPSSKRPKVTHEEDSVELQRYSEWMRNILAKPCSEMTEEDWDDLTDFPLRDGTCSGVVNEILTNHRSVQLDHFNENEFDQIEEGTTLFNSRRLIPRCLHYYRELNRFLSLECDQEPAFSDKIFYLMEQRCKKLVLKIQRPEETESEARRAPEENQKRVYPLFKRFMSNLPTNLEHLEIHIKDMDVLDCFPDLIVRKGTKLNKLTLAIDNKDGDINSLHFSERDRVWLLLYRCRHVKDLTLRNFPFCRQVSVEHLQIERWLKGLPLLRTRKMPVFESDCEALRLYHDIYERDLDKVPILCHLDTTFNHLKRLDMVESRLPIQRDFWADMFSKTSRTLRTVKLGNGINYCRGHIQAEAMINEAIEGPHALKLDCLWFSGAAPNFGDFFECQQSRMIKSLRLHLKEKPSWVDRCEAEGESDEPSEEEESSDDDGNDDDDDDEEEEEEEEEEEDLNCWRVLPCEISRYESLTELYLSFEDEDANTFLTELLPTLKNLKRLSIDLRSRDKLSEKSIQIISGLSLESLHLIGVVDWSFDHLDSTIPALCGLQSTPPLMLSLRNLSTSQSLSFASLKELLTKFKSLASMSFGKDVIYDSESSGEQFLQALTKHGKLVDCNIQYSVDMSEEDYLGIFGDITPEKEQLLDSCEKFYGLVELVCRKNRMRRWLCGSSENLKGKYIPQVLVECDREEKRLNDYPVNDDEPMLYRAAPIFEILKDDEVLRELGLV